MHAADVREIVTQGLPEAPADTTNLSSRLESLDHRPLDRIAPYPRY